MLSPEEKDDALHSTLITFDTGTSLNEMNWKLLIIFAFPFFFSFLLQTTSMHQSLCDGTANKGTAKPGSPRLAI